MPWLRSLLRIVFALFLFVALLFVPERASADDGSGSGSSAGAALTAGSGLTVTRVQNPCAPGLALKRMDDNGNVVCGPPHAEVLPDPTQHPLEAWDDVKLARKTSWPLAVFAVLLMLTKALAYGATKLQGTPVIGAAAKWLAEDKHAMWVTGLGALAAAGYNALIDGGSLVAALVAAAMAFAGVTHSTTQSKAS